MPVGDILLLAGDVVPFAEMDKHTAFFDFLSHNFEAVYWVPGNHEYYGSDIAERSGSMDEAIRSNVFLVNNHTVLNDGLKLVFTTLWSEINPLREFEIERGMSDFYQIRDDGGKFRAAKYTQLHANAMAFLGGELSKPHDGKTIVVTHHVPTFMHYPEQYKFSVLNTAFATELHDFIATSAISHWLYGHHHSNIPDFTIGNTQVVTNQLGYVEYGEHAHFNSGKTL